MRNKNSQLWGFIGFDVDSRFGLNFELGSRTTFTATKLVAQPKQFIGEWVWFKPLKITTDKLAAYKNALGGSL